jgi:hypothetical protein
MDWKLSPVVLVLTAINISYNIDASTIKRDEAEREKHAHAKPSIVRSAGVPRNHGRLQTDRNHTATQSSHYRIKISIIEKGKAKQRTQ